MLASFFAQHFAQRMTRKIEPLTERCIRQLKTYDWPGNVRELQNVIERAVITSRESRLELEGLLPPSAASKIVLDSAEPTAVGKKPILTMDEIHQLERENLTRALSSTGWRVSGKNGAAQLLGIPASTLSSRIKAFGIKRPK
jgi:transcriptional regulator with GAF, ATPase, and Fis domain